MQLSVLSENTALEGFQAEHGLSYLIEAESEKILFDTGQSDVYIRNAEKLGIDLGKNISKIVLSHGHWDHGDGLKYLNNKYLITHPAAFSTRQGRTNKHSIGLSLILKQLENKFEVIKAAEPFYITENILFLGEIPRLNDFESQSTPYYFKDNEPDFVPDDSALVVVQNQELKIITGCSHSGICNICEYAKKVTGISRISAVMGGFHLKKINHQTQKTIEYFQQNNVQVIYPSHCTAFVVISEFEHCLKTKRLRAGMVLKW